MVYYVTHDPVAEHVKLSVLLHLSLQEIARAGNLLDELTREILQQVCEMLCHFTSWIAHVILQCPHEGCRNDLQAYLQRVKLCSHQLKITSAVKADLTSSVRETVSNNLCYHGVTIVT